MAGFWTVFICLLFAAPVVQAVVHRDIEQEIAAIMAREGYDKQYLTQQLLHNSASHATDNALSNTESEKARKEVPEKRMLDYKKKSQRDQQEAELEEQPLKPFGYDIFANMPTDFTFLDNIPVAEGYLIGPADEVKITLFGKINEEYELTVSSDGTVFIPGLGQLTVAGSSFAEVEEKLKSKISQQLSGTEAVISLGKLRTLQVFVMGDVFQPGVYNLNSLATVTQSLLAAGGVDTVGSLRNIQVKRRGNIIKTLDLYDLLIHGDTSGDVRLYAGDAVFIPSKGAEVTISGEVKRPAIYELKAKTTLQAVLQTAGGLNATAYSAAIALNRKTDEGLISYTLDLANPQHSNFQVKDGDEIDVRKKTTAVKSAVSLQGAVARPGQYRFSTGMTVTDIIASIDSDVLPNADLSFALVVRYETVAGLKQEKISNIYQIDLRALNKADNNITLAAHDQIIVFDNSLNKEEHQELDEETADTESMHEAYLISEKNLSAMSQTDLNEKNATAESREKTEDQQQQYSRQHLLKPILTKLAQQSSSSQPVKLVEIAGEVKYPGIYPLVEKHTLGMLLQAAGGLDEAAYRHAAELDRFVATSAGDTYLEHKKIELARAPDALQFVLQSKDRVNIYKQNTWQREIIVDIKGEVKFPGKYSSYQGETLFEVLDRAGGITEFGYAKGAVFTRRSIKEQQTQQAKKLADDLRSELVLLNHRRAINSSSSQVGSDIYNKLYNMEAVGRVIVNLEALSSKASAANLMLENGDTLYVPPLRNTISIIGQVQGESTYLLDSRKRVDDYIQLAGGTKAQADLSRIYIIRANGGYMKPSNSYWFKRSANKLEPGDTIVVPIDIDYTDKLTLWSSATQILYQTAVAWSAVHSTLD